MRLLGYCKACHHYKQVRPTTRLLGSGVVMGLCAACEEERDADRRREQARAEARRRNRRR